MSDDIFCKLVFKNYIPISKEQLKMKIYAAILKNQKKIKVNYKRQERFLHLSIYEFKLSINISCIWRYFRSFFIYL